MYSFIGSLIQEFLQPVALANLPFLPPFPADRGRFQRCHTLSKAELNQMNMNYVFMVRGVPGFRLWVFSTLQSELWGLCPSYSSSSIRFFDQSFTGHIGSRGPGWRLWTAWIAVTPGDTWFISREGQNRLVNTAIHFLKGSLAMVHLHLVSRCWTSCGFPCWASLGSQHYWSSWKCDWMISMRRGWTGGL